MAMPTITTEVALTTDPGATPTWTDISAYQEEFVIHRGRADDQSAFGPGQLQLTLANEDRRFDPAYTSSPYSPNVVPMRRVRIRATYNAITYDVFNGYVTNWRQVYSPPQVAKCVVEATDALKVLANIDLPLSVYEAEVRTDNPAVWWRLGEPSGSDVAYDASGNGRNGTRSGAVTFGAAGLVVHDPDTAATFTETAYTYVGGKGPTIDGTTPWALELWFSLNANPAFIQMVALGTTPAIDWGLANYFALQINNVTRLLSFIVANTAGTIYQVNPPAALNAGQKYHLVITHDSDRVLRAYLDGALVATGDTTAGTIAIADLYLGSPSAQAAPNAVIDEYAVYTGGTTALSTTRIAAHNSAGRTPWTGDLSGARVGRVLDAAGWPAADRNVDTGVAVLQAADLAQTALTILQKIEQTEQGALFVTAAGLVRFIARDALLKAPYVTSQGTFGDSGSELEYGDLTYVYNDGLIFNEVHVSRSGGTVAVVKDTASQTKYLRRTKTLDGLLHQSDATSIDLANWVLAHHKDPTLRVTGMRLEPSRGNEATHFPHVLGRELMDRVTALRRPQNLGAAISQDTLIEGITHTVTAVDWVTDWNLSPAEAQAYWILGVTGFSELDQTTRLGF